MSWTWKLFALILVCELKSHLMCQRTFGPWRWTKIWKLMELKVDKESYFIFWKGGVIYLYNIPGWSSFRGRSAVTALGDKTSFGPPFVFCVLELSRKSPCLWACFHSLSPLLVLSAKKGNFNTFNAQGSKIIVVVVQVGVVTPSLYWVGHCNFLPTKNGKEIKHKTKDNGQEINQELHTIPLLSWTLQFSAHQEWEGNKPRMAYFWKVWVRSLPVLMVSKSNLRKTLKSLLTDFQLWSSGLQILS
jgi:hypothetical protein